MSLNGLDDPAIIESYQTALTEAGGWFLIKYVSRDVVALLARGTGGVAEIRITIDSYEEKSPLYGFLQYRRRKVILRYVPEGVSRILQARISVQFQSVLDKFSPHDTVFSLTVSSELTENALSSACLLHTASRSMTSSSSSLRRCQLGEITEDAEVEESASIADRSIAESSLAVDDRRGSIYSRTSEATAVPGRYKAGESQAPSVAETASIRSRGYSDHRSEKPLPSIPHDYTRSRTNGVAHKNLVDQLSQCANEPRKSTQSSRPSTRDLDQASLRPPKIKLGPRPSVDVNGRPRTAGSMGRSRESRPVAALPAGVRLTSRRSYAPRPKSQPDLIPPTLADAPPIPTLLPPPPVLGSFSRNPPASPKSARSVASSTGVTPEKQRLMKALELRKRQIEKQSQEAKRRNQQEEAEPRELKHDTSQDILTRPCVKPEVCEIKVEEVQETKPEEPADSSQSIPELPAAVEAEAKVPVGDPSKLDSAVDLSVAEQTPQKDVSTPSMVLDHAEASSSLALSSGTPHTPDTDVTELSKADQHDHPPSSPSPAGKTTASADDTLTQLNKSLDAREPADINPCEIEIPSDLQCPDTPTPRAIPVEFSQTTDPESERSSIERPGSTNASEEISQPDTEVSQYQSDVSLPIAEDKNTEQDPESQGDNEKHNDRKQKRRAILEPIHIPGRNEDLDEENLLSDDSFMEELKSATVQEAKPVAVPKTPLTPFSTSGDLSSSERWRGSRIVSNPSAGGIDIQALPIGRSASGSYFNNQDAIPVLVAKKVNVSSGISKRIKALEMFSSRESGPSHAPVVPSSSTSTSPFEKFRKRATMSPANVLSPSTPKGNKSQAAQEGSNQIPKRNDSLSPTGSTKGKPNSVSVTARIVRDPSAPPPDPSVDPSEPSVLNLQRSQLIVEHDGDGETHSTRPISPPPKQERKRWSISSIGSKHIPDAIPLRRSDSTTSKLSVSSRSKLDGPLPRLSTDTHTHLDSVDEVLEDKKESRKSRLMRRMSTITSHSRRGIINALSPTVKEEDPPTPPPKEEEEQSPELPQVVDIGEVNVQFPDTLLWKRRFMRIDDHGYLILTPGTIDGTTRNIIKRYHLSEFRTPSLPDQDRQELPNSIVLDFKNGSTLQCACESRNGQKAVLQILLEAHNSYQHR
ncbi:hypothetical protein CPC735_016580 [Coccidioides posadasii C735 delta SOWgp]|uniref:GPI-anchored cell surface glycoprotein n=1 Tax=Coccidioides posadasii (strain C735) TaxID=222929 RepID=C5PD96_COCP7|nr:hypothetical protein CPC735_016580 [Coccidioides posadasii C735 delta SOWgp]EER25057.1 hypothetical protein CPC735_016580 [Coccidioides posadasii C735 delta SOWgp]|eukprot:XP_003067202.1 hypothetical protein CPC735_016580 [Coccidioides posadasii C735 delta SOWgp]